MPLCSRHTTTWFSSTSWWSSRLTATMSPTVKVTRQCHYKPSKSVRHYIHSLEKLVPLCFAPCPRRRLRLALLDLACAPRQLRSPPARSSPFQTPCARLSHSTATPLRVRTGSRDEVDGAQGGPGEDFADGWMARGDGGARAHGWWQWVEQGRMDQPGMRAKQREVESAQPGIHTTSSPPPRDSRSPSSPRLTLQMSSSRLPAALQATEEDISLLLQAQAHIGCVPASLPSLDTRFRADMPAPRTVPRTSRRR